MKKACLFLLMVVSIVFLVASLAWTASPFETVKAIALKGEIDQDGDHVFSRAAMVEGRRVGIAFCFSPKTGRIYVARAEGDETVVLMADLQNNVFLYGLFKGQAPVGTITGDRESAERFTLKVLEEAQVLRLI